MGGRGDPELGSGLRCPDQHGLYRIRGGNASFSGLDSVFRCCGFSVPLLRGRCRRTHRLFTGQFGDSSDERHLEFSNPLGCVVPMLRLADEALFRLFKIQGIIEESRYGINDLSAVALDAATGLPR